LIAVEDTGPTILAWIRRAGIADLRFTKLALEAICTCAIKAICPIVAANTAV